MNIDHEERAIRSILVGVLLGCALFGAIVYSIKATVDENCITVTCEGSDD